MAKFICLTEACGNDFNRPLIINADHIQYVQLGKKTDTYIRMSDKTVFFVKESFNDIKALIAGPVRLPPAAYSSMIDMKTKELV